MTNELLRPIGRDNRPETVIIPFHRFIKNTNYAILRNLMATLPKDASTWEDDATMKLFPQLKNWLMVSRADNFRASNLFNLPEMMLRHLSNDTLDASMACVFKQRFGENLHLHELHYTRLEMALIQLLTAKFMKDLYIYADTITTEMEEYLVSVFIREAKRVKSDCTVHLIEGEALDTIVKYHEATTIFLNDSSEFFALKEYDPKLIENRYFLIGQGVADMLYLTDKEQYYLQHTAEFSALRASHVCEVTYMYLDGFFDQTDLESPGKSTE